MNRTQLGILFILTITFVLFQNMSSPYSGGLGGVAPFSEGHMVWGWACRIADPTPVRVNLYFYNPKTKVETFWKYVMADDRNTATAAELKTLCGTTGVPHEFKVRLSYSDALKFKGQQIVAYAKFNNLNSKLSKYSTYSDILTFDPELAFTKYGWVKGMTSQAQINNPISTSTISFKGIPYASPPVGRLRWAASVPPRPWLDNKPATTFGPPCMQEDEHYKLLKTSVPPSEDCLYLNVWKPVNKVNRPVMVYIHGGQFKGGWSGLPDYDGAYLASQDIVFVSFNYRVGMMGFFTHLLFDSISRGNVNFGLTDQELAFKWVKENISEFGGDPNNITIIGSSAGGASVGYWMTNNEAQGLFNKAIIESGGGSLTSWLPTKATTRNRGLHLTNELISLGEGNKYAECVDHVSNECWSKLLFETDINTLKKTSLFNRYLSEDGTRYDPIQKRSGFEFHPILDKKYVVGGILDLFYCGVQKNRPLIVGSMGWEANIVEDAIKKNPTPFFDGIRESTLANIYNIKGTENRTLLAERFYGDKTFGVPSQMIARYHSRKNPNTYLFFFNYIGDEMEYTKGATHQLLTPFVFRSLETKLSSYFKPSDVDKAVSSVWSGYWQNFVMNNHSSGSILNSRTIYSPPPWTPHTETNNSRLFVNHSGMIVSPGQREFGDRQTYNYSFEGILEDRYNFIESVYYNPQRYEKCSQQL